jgi:hypothetical protein
MKGLTHKETRNYWKKVIDDARKSGITGTRYCKLNGIHLASFRKWSQRYATKSQKRLLAREAERRKEIELKMVAIKLMRTALRELVLEIKGRDI